MKVHDQLNPVATEAAEPRILAGKISPIISHGIGPENEKKKKNVRSVAIKSKQKTKQKIFQPIFK